MLLIIGTTLAIVLLDWPWRAVVIGALAAVEVLEVLLWLKLRRLRALTGEESLAGARGRTLTDCGTIGQVRVRGVIWKARCAEPTEAGADVEVVGVDGLTLEVRALPAGAPAESGMAEQAGAGQRRV